MIDDSRVDRLLEELLESGGSPEEICRSCPELLPRVRAGLLRLRQLEQEVGALFPPADSPGGVGPAPGALARLAETLGDIPRVHLRDAEPFTGPGPVVGEGAQLVDRDHAGMLQLARDLGLLDEPADQVGLLAMLLE